MTVLTRKRLDELLDQFTRLRIGLLGDLFLDRYFEIDPDLSEVSIETQLEAHQVVRVRNSAGALGTILNNLAALGVGQLVPTTVIGDDGLGYDLLATLRSLPVDTSSILRSPQRLTPTYLKPLQVRPDHPPVELSRLDVRSRTPLEPDLRCRLIETLETTFDSCDGWIVLDQVHEEDCGVVHRDIRSALERLIRSRPDKLVFIDSRDHLGKFHCGTLKGNRDEVLRAAGDAGASSELEAKGRERVERAAATLVQRTQSPVYCTLGEDGVLCAMPSDEGKVPLLVHAPAVRVEPPVDIVGAGDSATSGIVAALLCGASHQEAASLGNLVASITVQQLGTTGTASPAQLREALNHLR